MPGRSLRRREPVLWMTLTAVLMAANVVLCLFSVPVALGGHFYLNDIVIDTAALLLDPLGAFLVGGVGAFLGDLFFYPPSMFVSLIAHGLEAALIAFLYGRKKHGFGASLAITILGGVVMVAGYTLLRPFVYGTWEASLAKLPYECLQAFTGSLLSVVLVLKCGIGARFSAISNHR